MSVKSLHYYRRQMDRSTSLWFFLAHSMS